ncbi:MAG TPA: hypothetical protein VI306_18275 [Pyrinomonadaceae bacterium]
MLSAKRFAPGILALILTFIACLPQLHLCYSRGSDWNGSFAYFDTDELAYCSYENSLIDGRPRRNDPYNGVDNQNFETLFSVQFIPPYVLAGLAKLFHLSASQTFVLLVPLIVISAVLVIYKLVLDITQNTSLAAASGVGVLCLGSLLVHYSDFLPFLRRYEPAFPFPICLLLFLLVWKSLTRPNYLWSIGAAFTFVILIYSYFFLWTAAAAWLLCILLLWFVARSSDRRITLRTAACFVVIGGLGLIAYVWLLSQRASTMDQAQVLELTRTPDLLRVPELVGTAVLLIITFFAKTKKLEWREPRVLFVISLALAPFVIFNHQILTGRSLQPFHYTQFIANYMVTLAVFLLSGILWPKLPRYVSAAVVIVSLTITLALSMQVARTRLFENVLADQKRAVALRIRDENNDRVVFASDAFMTMLIPTEARNPMLWSRYSYIFGNITAAERKTLFFKYLYYSGFDEAKFMQAMQYDFTSRVEIFGAERTNPSLTLNHQEISPEEMRQAYQEYTNYCARFSRTDAANPSLGYAIVLSNVDLNNLNRWYTHDAGERVGDFIIYKVALK